MLENGFFIADDRDTFLIVDGSMYLVEITPSVEDRDPGYYTPDWERIEVTKAVDRMLTSKPLPDGRGTLPAQVDEDENSIGRTKDIK